MEARLWLYLLLFGQGFFCFQLLRVARDVRPPYLAFQIALLLAFLACFVVAGFGAVAAMLAAVVATAIFVVGRILPDLLEARALRALANLRFTRALAILGWLRHAPTRLDPAKVAAVARDHLALRSGDPEPIIARAHGAWQAAVVSGEHSAVVLATHELLVAYVLAQRYDEARALHARVAGGEYPAWLPEMTIAGFARAHAARGDLAQVDRALAALEARDPKTLDGLSHNIVRVLWLAYFGAGPECEELLREPTAVLGESAAHVRAFYRAVAWWRAGERARAEAAFAEARAIAPADEALPLARAIDSFLDSLGDAPPAPRAPIAARIESLTAQLRPYAAVPADLWTWKSAPITWCLLGLNLLTWLALALRGDTLDAGFLIDHGALFPPAIAAGEWWRLLVPIALHAGFAHVALNSLGLVYLGAFTERLYGSLAFLVLYAAAGIAGTISSTMAGVAVSVGASGAIYGVLGALIAQLLRGRQRFPAAWRAHYLSSMLLLAALNLFISAQVEQVDNAAHLGGLVGGLIVGWLFSTRQHQRTPSRARRFILAACIGILAGTTTLAAERVVSTSREITKARLAPRTHTLGALELERVPGWWLARPVARDSLALHDPYGGVGAIVTLLGTQPLALPRLLPPQVLVGALARDEIRRHHVVVATDDLQVIEGREPSGVSAIYVARAGIHQAVLAKLSLQTDPGASEEAIAAHIDIVVGSLSAP